MRFLSSLPASRLEGVEVLVRADLNVPMEGGVVTDEYRLSRSLPTIKALSAVGAKVVLVAHVGRDPEESLSHVHGALRGLTPTTFVHDVVGGEARAARSAMRAGDVLLLENVRQEPGEVANDLSFSRALVGGARLYVNDAFSASHRMHASIAGVPALLPSCAGLLFEEEMVHLSKALAPEGPSLAILGGAKFDTKEPLIKKLLDTYDHLYLAGALVNDAFKALGFEVGRSLVSEHFPDRSILSNPKLLLPKDVLVERVDEQGRVRRPSQVAHDEKIVDIGPDSFAELLQYIKTAHFILWNGPTGLYEDGYDDWTHAIAQAVAESEAFSVVGGGDTVASIRTSGLEGEFDFLSTAGGAMLEYLINGTLPGIEALEKAAAPLT